MAMLESSWYRQNAYGIIILMLRVKWFGLIFAVALLTAGNTYATATYPFLIADYMRENYINNDASIDYAKHSSETNGNGIFLNSESGTYFYRGVVDNNIIYDDICWQIMGTTMDGAVKLIYSGIPSASQTCENIGDAAAGIINVSYGAPSNGNYAESNAKAQIDKWFEENLIDHLDDFADTMFCNDVNYASAHERIAERGEPSLLCSEDQQYTVENGKLKYPVAMMTADELLFSGAGYGVAPTDGEAYYADTGKFQTMTQQSANKMYYNNSIHFMNRSSGTNYSANIRPVIAVADDSAYILGGTGTKLDPYKLKVIAPVLHKIKSLNDSISISNNMEEAIFGQNVSFAIDSGRKVKLIRLVDGSGNALDVEIVKAGVSTYTFTMPDQDVYIDVEYEEEKNDTPSAPPTPTTPTDSPNQSTNIDNDVRDEKKEAQANPVTSSLNISGVVAYFFIHAICLCFYVRSLYKKRL